MANTPYATDRQDANLADGNKALHIQPDVYSGLPRKRWYLSRWMEFEGGNYTIRSVVDDSATWWIGRRANEARMVMAHSLGQYIYTQDVYIASGVQRIDILIENVTESISPTYIDFTIWKDGKLVYVSDSEGWLSSYDPIPDEALPKIGDPRRRLPVFSVLPNWKNGLTERLSWRTDVMQSESGAEQRRAVRVHPRRSFEASFLRKGNHRTILDNFFVGVGRGEFMVPLWHEAVRMTQGINAGAAGVSFEGSTPLSAREFRTGDLVFVNNGDARIYDILEVGSIQSSRFDWKEPPTRGWPKGTRIYPMRIARIIDRPQMSNVTDSVATAQVRFDLVEPDERTPSWGLEYGGQGLFTFIPNRVEPIQLSYDRVTFTLDNESAVPIIVDPGRDTQVDLTASFMLRGRASVANLRRFMAAARGEAVAFYMMTYTDDIELVDGISGSDNWLDITDSSYSHYIRFQQPVRLMVGVWTYGSGWIIRTITGSEPGRLYLDEPFPTLSSFQIRRICFVTPARFAQDSIELQHISSESSIVTTRLVFKQLFNKRLEI